VRAVSGAPAKRLITMCGGVDGQEPPHRRAGPAGATARRRPEVSGPGPAPARWLRPVRARCSRPPPTGRLPSPAFRRSQQRRPIGGGWTQDQAGP